MKLAPVGFRTLLRKEIARFMSVPTQTVATPVVTAMLYLLIFGQALGSRISPFHGVPFIEFLIPELVVMGIVNHSFQNTSSSLTVSKFEGNVVDLLVAPMSHTEILMGYAGGGLVRGLVVGRSCPVRRAWSGCCAGPALWGWETGCPRSKRWP